MNGTPPEEDFFDEDDLINDYIAQEDEFQELIPDFAIDRGFDGDSNDAATQDQAVHVQAEIERQLADTVPQANASRDVTSNQPNSGHRYQPDTEGGTKEKEGALEATGSTMASGTPPLQEIQVTRDGEKRSQKREYGLFSFERYNGDQTEWRKALELKSSKRSEDKFSVKQWKDNRETTSDSSSLPIDPWVRKGSSKSSAPASQLMDLNSFHQHYMDSPIELSHPSRRSPHYHRRTVDKGYSLLPEEGVESFPMTIGDGTVLHVKKNKHQETKGLNKPKTATHLLGCTIQQLLTQSDRIVLQQQQHQTRRQRTRFAIVEDDASASRKQSQKKTSRKKLHQLWVDKHAPQSFSHLLSEERINRGVLRALRAWDPYVFPGKKTPPPLSSSTGNDDRDHERPTHDRLRPPEKERVLLLCGPPGVGKTTLAHICARQAGYFPMEINGSDDRSATTLKERVIRSMECSTTLRSDGRPNCLILDEIDGADAKGALSALVPLIRAEIASPATKTGSPANKKRQTRQHSYLRRPLILIANHKYAPVLRPLLPYCRVFDVSPPSNPRLVARLRAVLVQEQLSIFGGSGLLHKLVQFSGGDVRSCLHTLQFAAARARDLKLETSKRALLESVVVDISNPLKMSLDGGGMKDGRNDLSSTITSVFRQEKNGNVQKTKSRVKCTSEQVLKIAENFGDHSRTLDCLFTNVPQVSYVDPSLERCCLAHDYMSATDLQRTVAYFDQQKYASLITPAIHLLCRVETKSTNLVFSTRQMFDAHYLKESQHSLVLKFLEGLAPGPQAWSVSRTVLESIPFILWILSAGHGSCSLSRPVSSLEILSKNERVAFSDHVRTLRSLGLTYVVDDMTQNHYGSTTSTRLRLEPEIHRLSSFKGLVLQPSQRLRHIPPSLKELLAHQATLENLREGGKQASSPAAISPSTKQERNSTPAKTKKSSTMLSNASKQTKKQSLSNLQSPTPNTFPPKKKAKISPPTDSKNFLGKAATKAKAKKLARKAARIGIKSLGSKGNMTKLSHTGSGIPLAQVVRFKYQKGFTQAVRTKCRFRDLA